MKFGESLSEGLVPEWKDLYVDYKAGKKFIKKAKENKDLPQDEAPLLERPQPTYHTNEPTTDRPPSRRKQSIFNYSLSSFRDSKKNQEPAKDQFMEWLANERAKVDGFFKEKEQEVYTRFLLLQDQLYQLRDHKTSMMKEKGELSKAHSNMNAVGDLAYHTKNVLTFLNKFEWPSLPSTKFLHKLREDSDIKMDNQSDEMDPISIENGIRNGDSIYSTNSTDLDSIDSDAPDHRKLFQAHPDQIRQAKRRDYVTKTKKFSVPYLYARKRLKDATLEHYRALSLLRSFKVLNRTAFRKITKKYDKATGSSISAAYMERLDKEAYFMVSDLVDKLINHVEDLFITFYDPDTVDRKHSLEKLRSIAYAMNEARQPTFYQSSFFSGLLLGFAFSLLVLGIYSGLHNTLTGRVPEGALVLQIWAGFFFLNLVFLLFGINMMVFEHFKINYKFIFEFNMSTVLNFKQYFVLPSVGMGLLAVLSWFSFNDFWPHTFPGRDWPWIYLGLALCIFLWPGPQMYGPSRRWLQIALWRLLFSGFYPVEFRDFFLGDILCSITYTMGNLSFFFCLYAHHWNGLIDGNPGENVCGSSKSRLMGFFSTVPSILRFLQCVRRYMDTGDWFPHLANMSKYAISTTYYCMLSVYRVRRNTGNRAVFIFFACINSIYSSAWDVIMDWLLFQSGSKYKYLRNNLFFKQPIYYYVAIVVDVLLRFQWIFYAFFTNQIQQLAVTSFCIALAEVLRRFIWIFFRMENEHCTNVILFRALKDTPLPYPVTTSVERAIKKLALLRYGNNAASLSPVVPEGLVNTDAEMGTGSSLGTGNLLMRKRTTFTTFSDTLNKAHMKDFQRRKTIVALDEDSDDE